jgi:hypothetical protein
MLFTAAVVRRCIERRMFFLLTYTEFTPTPMFMDTQLIRITSFYILLYSATSLEYLLRHVLGMETQYAYDAMPYIAQFLSILMFSTLLWQCTQFLKKRELEV